jgi:hypothetical protein
MHPVSPAIHLYLIESLAPIDTLVIDHIDKIPTGN